MGLFKRGHILYYEGTERRQCYIVEFTVASTCLKLVAPYCDPTS